MIIHSQSSPSHSAICPFCHHQNELRLEDMLLYFENDKLFLKSNYTDSDGYIISQLESAFKEHNRPKGKFKRHWESELNKGNSGQNANANTVIGGKGIVLDPAVFVENGKKRGNQYTIGRFTLTYDSDRPLLTTINLDGGGQATPDALCCPHCECFFPLNFFDLDCYFIILAGESSVGKTMWLTSLFRNGFSPLQGMKNRDKGWNLVTEFSAPYDGPSRAFKEGVTNYTSKGIIPKATPNAIPPIFLTLTWTNYGGAKKKRKDAPPQTYTHNVCVIDTMGEMWGTDNEDGSTKSIKFANIADATIYIVQPYQGLGYAENDGNQSMYIAMDLFDNDYDLDISPSTDSSENNNASDSRKKVRKYYELYLRHFCNNPQFKKKPCAFVITQADIYNSPAFSDNIQDIKYFDSIFSDCDATGRTDRISDRTVLLDMDKLGLHNIAAYHLVRKNFPQLKGAANTLEKSNFFAISSFSGDKKEKGMFETSTGKLFPKKKLSQKEWDEYAHNSKFTEVDFIETSYRNQAVNIHEPMLWTLLCLVGDKLTAAPAPEKAREDNLNPSPAGRTDPVFPQEFSPSIQPDFHPVIEYQKARIYEPSPASQDAYSAPLTDASVDLSKRENAAPSYQPQIVIPMEMTDETADFGKVTHTVDFEKENEINDLATSIGGIMNQSASVSDIPDMRSTDSSPAHTKVRKKISNTNPEKKAAISLDDLIKDDESDNTTTIFHSFLDDDN